MTSFLLRWLGWAALAWGVYGLCESVRRDYTERARLQAEHLWLYKHCLENAQQLRAHTDACDKVGLLFAESPLEGALLHPAIAGMRGAVARVSEWHAAGSAFVTEHRYAFAGLWLVLFVTLPRLCLQLVCPPTREKARLRAAAVMSSLESGRLRRRYIV